MRCQQRSRTVSLSPVADQSASTETSTPMVEIEMVLASLTTDDREALVLRFVFDLSGEDTATALGISHAAARQRISRARAAFKKNWEDS